MMIAMVACVWYGNLTTPCASIEEIVTACYSEGLTFKTASNLVTLL